MDKIRLDHELAVAVVEWGWKYHHIGTDEVMPNERYLPHLKFYVSGFNTSPFGIEWMRFDKDCPISDIIKSVPPDGVRAAMILHNGAPVELIEFKNKNGTDKNKRV